MSKPTARKQDLPPIEEDTLEKARARLKTRQRLLLDLLPQHQWRFCVAGPLAGYTQDYSRHELAIRCESSPTFSRAADLKMAEIQEITWTVEGWRDLIKQGRRLAREKGDLNTVKGYDDMIARHIGSYEQDNRQKGDKIAILLQ